MFQTNVQAFFDPEIKKMNVENCYFPMFVLDCHLKKEEAHNYGFKQEVRVFKFDRLGYLTFYLYIIHTGLLLSIWKSLHY